MSGTAPKRVRRLPRPGDFAGPPSRTDLRRWADADRAARPVRLGRLRARMATEGVDAYYGVKPEHMRYLTGFTLEDGEEKVAGHSGQFLVGPGELVVLTDSRYTVQARREATDARVVEIGYELPTSWPGLLDSLGGPRRVAVEAAAVSHDLWGRLERAAPDVELVAAGGWIEQDRAVKEAAEVERIASACAVADRALAVLLGEIRPGVTEAHLAWRLEVLVRTGGAGALAFGVAALSGSQAALPHGAPRDHRIRAGGVLLFDFGAQVAGYRSDMTRTLFVGSPRDRDLAVYDLVARAQRAAISALESAVAEGAAATMTGRAVDDAARAVIDAGGHARHFGHGTGHGIGLATHELPRLSYTAPPDLPLPSPTVFSVEPGVYLAGRTGVRIEDLIHFDARAGIVERLTHFPREVVVVPARP